MRETLQSLFVIRRFIEALVDFAEVPGIYGLQSDKDTAGAAGSHEVQEFFILQQVHADLCDPIQRCSFRDHGAQKRLRSLDVDGEIVINEEYPDRSVLRACPVFHTAQFSNHAVVRSKANRIPEKPRDRAEIAAVRTASSGFDRKNVEAFP